MQFRQEEYVLLSRRGSVPRPLSKRPPPQPQIEPELVVIRQRVRRKSLVEAVQTAAAMTRAMIVSVQEQRRHRP